MPFKPSRLVIAALTVLCAALLVLAPRSTILTTIAIRAPPARVWAALTDTASYPRWNPMIAGLKGDLVVGATIENIEGYGAQQVIFWPRVQVVLRNRELRWRGRLWGVPLLFVGEHYFLLRPTPEGTRFTQGEHFSGALLWLFDARTLVPAFEAMNLALAARATAK